MMRKVITSPSFKFDRSAKAKLTKRNEQSDHNYRYSDFGSIEPSNGNFTEPHNSFTYTGQLFDSSMNLYEFYSRAYDPETGSWLQQDRYRGEVTNPNSLYRYQYVENSPVRYWDWYGFSIEDVEKQIGEKIGPNHPIMQAVRDYTPTLVFEEGNEHFPVSISLNPGICDVSYTPTIYYNVAMDNDQLYIDYWMYYQENVWYPSIFGKDINPVSIWYHKQDLEHILMKFTYIDGMVRPGEVWASNHDPIPTPFGDLKKGYRGGEDYNYLKSNDNLLFQNICNEEGCEISIVNENNLGVTVFVGSGSHAMSFSPENIDSPKDNFDGMLGKNYIPSDSEITIIQNFNLIDMNEVDTNSIPDDMHLGHRVEWSPVRDTYSEPWKWVNN